MSSAPHSFKGSTLFWSMGPFLVVLFLVFLTFVPFQLPFSAIELPLPLLGLFYWAVFRPDSLSVGVVFVLGLLVDLLGGLPIGSYAFLYVFLFSLTKTQRRFLLGQGFIVVWFAFLLVCMIHQAALWLGFSFFQPSAGVPIYPLLFGGLAVAALLPVVIPALNAMNGRLDRAEEEAL